MVVLDDGSIRVVTSTAALPVLPSRLTMFAVFPDGGFDATFGDGGLLALGPFGAHAWGRALIKDGPADLVAGGGGDDTMMLVATSEDGVLDPAFGTDGIEYVPPMFLSDGATTLAAAPPNRIVAAGYQEIRLLEADGSLVSTFAGDGVAEASIPASWYPVWPQSEYLVRDVLVQPDGRILVLGLAQGDGSSVGAMVIARLLESGTLDPSFGVDGVYLHAKDNYAAMSPKEMLRLPDGRMLVAGSHDGYFFVTRLMSDGTLDTSFGDMGWVQHVYQRNIAWPSGSTATGIVLLPDDSIVIVCSVSSGSAVLRMSPDGEVDLSFGDDPYEDGWGINDSPFDGVPIDLLFQAPDRLITLSEYSDDYADTPGIALHAHHVY
jgi:uncharacterized delta-60 repeat protein